jgi:membrane protein
MAEQLVPQAAGHDARSPWAIPAAGWKAILRRTWAEAGEDNISLIAAGVAFYAFLSIVPLLGAVVLIYGIVADPATVSANVAALTEVMPKQVAGMIGEQLLQVVTTSKDAKGFGLVLALGLALYGAMRGAEAIVTALNIAYEEHDDRGFVQQKLLALGVTIGMVVVVLAAILSVAMMAFLDSLIPDAPAAVLVLTRLVSYLILAGLGAAGAATLYRYGPDRAHAQWVWLTPGSVGATLIWIAMTVGFGFYVANFGSYDATYGSLGAIVVMLTWLSLSAYVFLLGAELNSELERQTDADTTTGPSRPAGARGAAVADDGAQAKPAPAPSPVWIAVAVIGAAILLRRRQGR